MKNRIISNRYYPILIDLLAKEHITINTQFKFLHIYYLLNLTVL